MKRFSLFCLPWLSLIFMAAGCVMPVPRRDPRYYGLNQYNGYAQPVQPSRSNDDGDTVHCGVDRDHAPHRWHSRMHHQHYCPGGSHHHH